MGDSRNVPPFQPYEEMCRRLPKLGHDIDDWTRRMIRWHFSEDTGSPFWLRQKETFPFDPLKDIKDFDSLHLFGFFDKEALRKSSPTDLLPQGLAGKPFRVFETGGSTGEPCRIPNVMKLDDELIIYEVMLEVRGLEPGNVVGMTPSGPHQYGHLVQRLADRWHTAAGLIDFDPRWIKKEIAAGSSAAGYTQHLLDQTVLLLERLRPTFLFTTSRLVVPLIEMLPAPLPEYGVRAVCTGGTSHTKEEARFLKEEYLADVTWIDTYGNTLVGHALLADPVDDQTPIPGSYHLPRPLGDITVVSPSDPTQQVQYGERGRVATTVLLEDLFIPNLLERDTAVRVEQHPWLPWDGVSEVLPLQDSEEVAIEGVY